jgi:hypothetical protein
MRTASLRRGCPESEAKSPAIGACLAAVPCRSSMNAPRRVALRCLVRLSRRFSVVPPALLHHALDETIEQRASNHAAVKTESSAKASGASRTFRGGAD